ncbi:MAG: hypothetical protein ABIJ59_05615 [Pseudomonadota bacterium]
MPGSQSAGMLEKNASNAKSPPAEAPMPTMGKSAVDAPTPAGASSPAVTIMAFASVSGGVAAFIFLSFFRAIFYYLA